MTTLAVPATGLGPRRTVDASAWSVCVRHGAPASQRVEVVVRPGPRGAAAIRTAGWPLCRECARGRATWLALAGLLVGVGAGAIALAVAVAGAVGPRPWLLVPLALGAGLALGAAWARSRGSLPRLAHARAAADGSAVLVEDAHPRFAQTR